MATNGQNMRLHFEGVLEKAGKRFFEGFRRRWFILDGKDLSYYKAPATTPENLLGIIDLTKVKAVVPFKMINNNAFQIITSTRTYTFTAATPQLMTEWISVLRQAMQLQSFKNLRAKNSIRASSEDESGYEVVSRSSRASSDATDQTSGNDDLYDKVASPGKEDAANNASMGTYESVGSFKRTSYEDQKHDQGSYEQEIEAYDSVRPAVKTTSSEELGSYGVIGDSGAQTTSTPEIYSVVQKKRSPSDDIVIETNEGLYAEVGNVDTKPPKITIISPMSIICESDDDDDDDNDDNDNPFVEENLEEVKDPLPPPRRDSYAVDQIRILLKDFKRNDSVEVKQENHAPDMETADPSIIPDSCDKAFVKLREFLNELENN